MSHHGSPEEAQLFQGVGRALREWKARHPNVANINVMYSILAFARSCGKQLGFSDAEFHNMAHQVWEQYERREEGKKILNARPDKPNF